MARKVTTVYKVVRRVRDCPSGLHLCSDQPERLMSAIPFIPPSRQTTYVPGKWVGPQHAGSLLFAYLNRVRAAKFRPGGPHEVWKADAEVVTKRMGFWRVTNGMVWMLSAFDNARLLSKFWRRKTKPFYPTGTPVSTIGCRRIRLVKRVPAKGESY